MKQPMTGAKKSVAKANGSNKPMRQVETSMSKKYKGTPKVSFKTIDDIKKMGMTAALKKAGTSKNPEYLEGIRRMYGAKRLAAAQGATAKPVAKKAFSPAQKTAMGMGADKKSAASAPKSNNPGYVAPRSASGTQAGNKAVAAKGKKSTYKAPKPSAQQVAQGKARAGGSKTTYKPGAGR